MMIVSCIHQKLLKQVVSDIARNYEVEHATMIGHIVSALAKIAVDMAFENMHP